MQHAGIAHRLAELCVLDVAPYGGLGAMLQARARGYLSIDLSPGNAMQVADLCALPF